MKLPFRPARLYPRLMTELDHVWSQMIDDAETRATNDGRRGVAEYLRLRATNDAIRAAGVGWLLGTMIEIAGRAMGERHGITIEREEPHNFVRGNSMMVGSLLLFRQGVRCLSVEAGWARTPADGIMQNGALVYGRITHFGMPKLAAEIRLVHADSLPQWLDDEGTVIDTGDLSQHFDMFLGS